jgi:hypothetical protein
VIFCRTDFETRAGVNMKLLFGAGRVKVADSKDLLTPDVFMFIVRPDK